MKFQLFGIFIAKLLLPVIFKSDETILKDCLKIHSVYYWLLKIARNNLKSLFLPINKIRNNIIHENYTV